VIHKLLYFLPDDGIAEDPVSTNSLLHKK
jgi:hypothetical protein